jgi:PadR family transcriptional regulator, regulatory protein AphA
MSPMLKLPLRLEHALLGFVRARPIHPYEIHQRLEQAEALGLVWRLKQSQLYALLGRLEEAGYLTSVTVPQGPRPPRKVLRLTPSGEAAFVRWLQTPVEHGREVRQEFMAKLFFTQQEGPQAVATLVARQREVCRETVAELQARRAALAAGRVYDDLVLQFRIGQLEATLVWLDTCAEALASRSST